jgi:anti-sigma-K factor RskA
MTETTNQTERTRTTIEEQVLEATTALRRAEINKAWWKGANFGLWIGFTIAAVAFGVLSAFGWVAQLLRRFV